MPELQRLDNYSFIFQRKTALGIYRFSLFLFLFIVSRYLFYYFELIPVIGKVISMLILFLTKVILHATLLFFSFFFSDLKLYNGNILSISGHAVIQLIFGCTGIIQLFQITIILLFYPIKWRQKAYLYPLSLIIVFIAAIIHFFILVPIAYLAPSWFQIFHDYTSRIVFFSMVFFTWVFWEKLRIEKNGAPSIPIIIYLQKARSDKKDILTSGKKVKFSILFIWIAFLIISYLFIFPFMNNITWLNQIIYIDKIAYITLYGILAFLALWACLTIVKRKIFLLYMIILIPFAGILIEVCQKLFSHSMSFFDSLNIIAIIAGTLSGALIFYFYLFALIESIHLNGKTEEFK